MTPTDAPTLDEQISYAVKYKHCTPDAAMERTILASLERLKRLDQTLAKDLADAYESGFKEGANEHARIYGP